MYDLATLSNGLTAITLPRPHSRSVAVSIGLTVGSRHETAAQAGMAHFLEHLVFKGSRRYPASRLSLDIESIGGDVNAATDYEATIYTGEGMARDTDLILSALLDAIRYPTILAVDIETERETILNELQSMVTDDPVTRVLGLINRALWKGGLSREIAGTPTSLRRIDRDMMRAFHDRHYRPERTVVCVAGGVVHEQVIDVLERETADWRRGDPHATRVRLPARGAKGHLSVRGDVAQTHFCLGAYGYKATDEHVPAASLLASILGDGMGSCLVRRLREASGLVYRIPVYHDTYEDVGAFILNTSADPRLVERIRREIDEEIGALTVEVKDTDLHRAREYLAGNFWRGLDHNLTASQWYCDMVLQHDPHTPEQEIELLYQVTPEQVRTVAREITAQEWRVAEVSPRR